MHKLYVSLWTARHTRQWTSRPKARQVALQYNYSKLRQQLRAVEEAECALDLVLSLLPYAIFTVDYESLCDTTVWILAALRSDLGLSPCDVPATSWAERQSSDKKTEFADMFRADLARVWAIEPDRSASASKTEVETSR